MFRGGLLRCTERGIAKKKGGKGSRASRKICYTDSKPKLRIHTFSSMYAESKFVSAHKFVPALP